MNLKRDWTRARLLPPPPQRHALGHHTIFFQDRTSMRIKGNAASLRRPTNLPFVLMPISSRRASALWRAVSWGSRAGVGCSRTRRKVDPQVPTSSARSSTSASDHSGKYRAWFFIKRDHCKIFDVYASGRHNRRRLRLLRFLRRGSVMWCRRISARAASAALTRTGPCSPSARNYHLFTRLCCRRG